MATVDRRLGLSGGLALKSPCVVATTGANITLSSTQTVDGVVVGSSERILVKDQTDSEQNGIYVSASGTWPRAEDFNGSADVMPGSLVYVDRGATNGAKLFIFNTSSTALSLNVGTTGTTITATALP